MSTRRAFEILLAGALLVGSCPAESAFSADDIVDSIGLNIHLHYDGTIYRENFPLLLRRLSELKIRHVRDGLVDTTWTGYYEHHTELGRAGIRATFITTPGQQPALLESYPARVSDFEQYEFPNEWDISKDRAWAETLKAFAPNLYSAAKNGAHGTRYAVVGPSLVNRDSYSQMRSVGTAMDYANIHNYFGGHGPGTSGWGDEGFGSIAWNLRNANSAWPGKPVITTETGYIDDVNDVQGLPQNVIAAYMPRLILEQYLHGIKRTYIYELADESAPVAGLIRADGTPKASYLALQNLLVLLNDPGPSFSASALDYTLSGATQSVHHLLLEKRNGTYFLFLWVERDGYDVNTKKYRAIPPQQVTVHFQNSFSCIRGHQFADSGAMTTTTSSSSSLYSPHDLSVTVTDKVLALELSSLTASSGSVPPKAKN